MKHRTAPGVRCLRRTNHYDKSKYDKKYDRIVARSTVRNQLRIFAELMRREKVRYLGRYGEPAGGAACCAPDGDFGLKCGRFLGIMLA